MHPIGRQTRAPSRCRPARRRLDSSAPGPSRQGDRHFRRRCAHRDDPPPPAGHVGGASCRDPGASDQRSRPGIALRDRAGSTELGLLPRRHRLRASPAMARGRRFRRPGVRRVAVRVCPPGQSLPTRSSEMADDLVDLRNLFEHDAPAIDGIRFGSSAAIMPPVHGSAIAGRRLPNCWSR